MKKQTAIMLAVFVLAGSAVAGEVLYGSRPSSDSDDESPLERQAAERRAYASDVQDSMRDKGSGRITVSTTDYGDVTLQIDASVCDARFVSDLTSAPRVKRRLKELQFEAVKCKNGPKIYATHW
jgi:hypothetical protein